METKTIDIENYFTEKNEREGVWHEPVIDDVETGLLFLLIGIHSEEAEKKMNEFDKKSDKVRNSELSDKEKEEKLTELDAERVAAFVKDIKTKDGAELTRNGKPIEFSAGLMKELFLNNPDLKMEIVDFVLKSANFIKR